MSHAAPRRSNGLRTTGAAPVSVLAALLVVAGIAIGAWLAGSRPDAPEPEPTPAAATPGPWFVERAAAAGLDFRHESGASSGEYWFPECVAGGVALLDHDGDGDLDVYLVQGGGFGEGARPVPNRLYRNDGGGTFADVTEAAGVGDTSYGMGATAADFDGDGDVDLYLCNVGANVLLRNDGDGTFTDVSAAAGVADPGFSSSAAFLDADGDGDLDLYVVNYVVWSPSLEITCYGTERTGRRDYCSPVSYGRPAPDRLYRNHGDGTFTDGTAAAGLDAAFGNGLGVACGDFDGDGRTDIYVANDAMPNQLWVQVAPGRFEDRALLAGAALNQVGAPEAGMGVVAVDPDEDGDLDLCLTHLGGETNTFYRNRDGAFDDATDGSGLGMPSWNDTGFGIGIHDFDHDGHLDAYIANGRVFRSSTLYSDDPYAEPNRLFRGRTGGGFEEVTPQGGTAELLARTSRGAAFGDLDGDGDIDIVVNNRDAAPSLLENVAARGHWIRFRVVDAEGRDLPHSRVRLEAGGGVRRGCAAPNQGYCSSHDPRVHFGLGDAATVDDVTVRWPDGATESFGAFAVDRDHVLRRGDGTAPLLGATDEE